MTPILASRLRKLLWPLLLSVVAAIVSGTFWLNANHPDHFTTPRAEVAESGQLPEAQRPDEWLYVTTNSVLFFPVVNDTCNPDNALGQVHKGTKVLVIARHGEWVEVEQDNQAAPHTHGCIHESMLEKRDD